MFDCQAAPETRAAAEQAAADAKARRGAAAAAEATAEKAKEDMKAAAVYGPLKAYIKLCTPT